MKVDWFSILILVCLVILVLNFYYMIQTPLAFERMDISLSPHTGITQTEARIYGLQGDELIEEDVVIESAKRDRYRAIMEAYKASSHIKVESLRINDAYENNNRIYLDIGPNSFSHPLIREDNIRMHIQALVNSLTTNDRQLPVQFLFDGSIPSETVLGVSFQQPFKRDETILGYSRSDMSRLVGDFLELIEGEKYVPARQMIYLSNQDRLTEGELLHALRSYRQAKKDTTARRLDVYSEGDGYLIQVHFEDSGRPENWNVQVINKLYYILFANSPIDR